MRLESLSISIMSTYPSTEIVGTKQIKHITREGENTKQTPLSDKPVFDSSILNSNKLIKLFHLRFVLKTYTYPSTEIVGTKRTKIKKKNYWNLL